jgi:uncharacterized protein (TIGR02145 family)
MKRQIYILVLMLSGLNLSSQTTYSFSLKVFLEGPFNGITMNTGLNESDLIPLSQPFNTIPWAYSGTETVPLIPNADIVDWVLVELRETTGSASTATPDNMINRQAAFLKQDGSIAGLDGSSLIAYSGTITNNLYVLIWHRNHLAVMSSQPLLQTSGIYSWDYTDQLSKAYLEGQKEIGVGLYGMYGGDSDANDTIQMADKDPMWDANAGIQNYTAEDLNIDSQVNNQDKDDIWFENLGAFAKIPTTIPFTCGSPLVDTRDGQSYNTVQIGTQCWMAESINIGLMISHNSPMSNNGVIEKYCNNNDELKCQEWGALYQWDEAMQYSTIESTQGICPVSWHIPSETEWVILDGFLVYHSVAGGKMKEAGYTHWASPNSGATNSSGFTGIGSGYIAYSETTPDHSLWTHNYIWASTQYGADYARRRLLFWVSTDSNPYYDYKWLGFSVRCVKD